MTEAPLILLIEDNEAHQLLACSVLVREGYRVDLAATVQVALERVRASAPDLIVMNLQLPGQGAFGLTRRLKADSKTSKIPIVAVTVHGKSGDKEEALAAGCSGYIAKPINTRIFGEQVRSYIVPTMGA